MHNIWFRDRIFNMKTWVEKNHKKRAGSKAMERRSGSLWRKVEEGSTRLLRAYHHGARPSELQRLWVGGAGLGDDALSVSLEALMSEKTSEANPGFLSSTVLQVLLSLDVFYLACLFTDRRCSASYRSKAVEAGYEYVDSCSAENSVAELFAKRIFH